jgi:hypothetical protein
MLQFKDFIVIGIYIYIVKNNDDTNIITFATLSAIALLCVRSKDIRVDGFDINEYLDNSTINKNTLPGKSPPTGKVNMPYDGVCLKTGNSDQWMKSPDNSQLIPNDKLYTYLANQIPLKTGLSDQTVLTGPPIDGAKGSPEKMFMWANNVSSPLCCPSTYTTSTGCICSTKNQRDFIAGRGTLVENKNSMTPGIVSDIVVEAQTVAEEL